MRNVRMAAVWAAVCVLAASAAAQNPVQWKGNTRAAIEEGYVAGGGVA